MLYQCGAGLQEKGMPLHWPTEAAIFPTTQHAPIEHILMTFSLFLITTLISHLIPKTGPLNYKCVRGKDTDRCKSYK